MTNRLDLAYTNRDGVLRIVECEQMLIVQFQPELNLSRRCRGCRDQPCRWRWGGGIGGVDHSIWSSEIRAVENVEEFRPELQIQFLRKRRILSQGEIQFRNSRTG